MNMSECFTLIQVIKICKEFFIRSIRPSYYHLRSRKDGSSASRSNIIPSLCSRHNHTLARASGVSSRSLLLPFPAFSLMCMHILRPNLPLLPFTLQVYGRHSADIAQRNIIGYLPVARSAGTGTNTEMDGLSLFSQPPAAASQLD